MMIIVHQDKSKIKNLPHLSFSFYTRELWARREYFIAEDSATGEVQGLLAYQCDYDSIYAPGSQLGTLFCFIGVDAAAQGKGVARKLMQAFFAAHKKDDFLHITGLEPDHTHIMIPLLESYAKQGYALYHRGTPWSVDNCIS